MRKAVQPAFLLGLFTLFLFVENGCGRPTSREDIIVRLGKDGPTKGTDGAAVTLVEFSDFQCSFCRKFQQETLPLIDKKYIQTGKIRFVYRHFAIFGKPSIAAGTAAECAGEQGRFWEFHDRLFASSGAPLAFTDAKLRSYATELQLQMPLFNQCLDSGKHSKKMEDETEIGSSLGVNGTPAFFLDDQMIVGAQPFEVFASLIEERLKQSGPGQSGTPNANP